MAIETAEERQVLVDLGARIRARRQARGLTLAALALRCGLPAAALSQIETGKRDLRVSSLFRIAVALGVTMETLLAVAAPRETEPDPDAGYDLGDLL